MLPEPPETVSKKFWMVLLLVVYWEALYCGLSTKLVAPSVSCRASPGKSSGRSRALDWGNHTGNGILNFLQTSVQDLLLVHFFSVFARFLFPRLCPRAFLQKLLSLPSHNAPATAGPCLSLKKFLKICQSYSTRAFFSRSDSWP